jgi:microcystin-dependent protein
MPAITPIQGFPYPVAGDSADVPRDIGALATKLDPLGFVPVGAMFMWVAVTAPAGYLLMIGQAVDAAAYPGLATLLGQAGGFVTIPDMRDRFPAGAGGNVGAVNAAGGAASVGLVEANNGPHAHLFNGTTGARDRSQAHVHNASDAGGYFALYLGGGGIVYYSAFAGNGDPRPGNAQTGATDPPDHFHPFSGGTDVRGSGTPHENRPPYRAVNFVIRAG